MEAIKKQVEDESQGKLCREQNGAVEAERETDVGIVEEEMNDPEDSIRDTDGYLSEEH